MKAFLAQDKNKALLIIAGLFIVLYAVPFSSPVVTTALNEAFRMVGEYVREHVLLCLIPAFFIAGGIMVFLNKQSVIQYLGPNAPKLLSYTVASVSGSVLAVCSCTVLPLFKGIQKKGAGLGPAISFLYSGPAINVLAVVLSARVLGLRLGLARAVGAVGIAFLIGLFMQLIFSKDEKGRETQAAMFESAASGGKSDQSDDQGRQGRTVLLMLSLFGLLIFLNWAPVEGPIPVWDFIYRFKYLFSAVFALIIVYLLIWRFKREEISEWLVSTRDFAVQVIPLLLIGVLAAGFLFGRPGHSALISQDWVGTLVGGNTIAANILAALSASLMYFATLTEIPILEGLLGAGMGQGPALSLLLAGPSLSLPSLLVIGSALGFKKTLTYALLVIVLSATAGLIFGSFPV